MAIVNGGVYRGNLTVHRHSRALIALDGMAHQVAQPTGHIDLIGEFVRKTADPSESLTDILRRSVTSHLLCRTRASPFQM
jgi:hypothetical protein